jgi:hypothetical protein
MGFSTSLFWDVEANSVSLSHLTLHALDSDTNSPRLPSCPHLYTSAPRPPPRQK